MSKTKVKLRRAKLHQVVVPAEDLNKPPSDNPLTGGLRGNCKWCGASIPLEMRTLAQESKESATYKLEDLMKYREAKTQPTHRLIGWCSICSLYGFDEFVDLSK